MCTLQGLEGEKDEKIVGMVARYGVICHFASTGWGRGKEVGGYCYCFVSFAVNSTSLCFSYLHLFVSYIDVFWMQCTVIYLLLLNRGRGSDCCSVNKISSTVKRLIWVIRHGAPRYKHCLYSTYTFGRSKRLKSKVEAEVPSAPNIKGIILQTPLIMTLTPSHHVVYFTLSPLRLSLRRSALRASHREICRAWRCRGLDRL